jgi:hypothetical protein
MRGEVVIKALIATRRLKEYGEWTCDRPVSIGYKESHRDQAFEESKHMRKAIAKSEPQDIIAIKRLIHQGFSQKVRKTHVG